MPDTSTLVFETSTPHATLALVGPDGIIHQRGFQSDRNHNALLFPPMQELMAHGRRCGIGLVLVGSGPGSYSGTRVGIAAAQGVAIALGCPAVAVPSVLAVESAADGRPCIAIGDARRGAYWSAKVEDFGLTGGPGLCDARQLEALVTKAAEEGIPVFSFEEAGRFPLPASLADSILTGIPDANRLWNAWRLTSDANRRAWRKEIPQPLYLKPPHITPAKRNPLLPR